MVEKLGASKQKLLQMSHRTGQHFRRLKEPGSHYPCSRTFSRMDPSEVQIHPSNACTVPEMMAMLARLKDCIGQQALMTMCQRCMSVHRRTRRKLRAHVPPCNSLPMFRNVLHECTKAGRPKSDEHPPVSIKEHFEILPVAMHPEGSRFDLSHFRSPTGLQGVVSLGVFHRISFSAFSI